MADPEPVVNGQEETEKDSKEKVKKKRPKKKTTKTNESDETAEQEEGRGLTEPGTENKPITSEIQTVAPVAKTGSHKGDIIFVDSLDEIYQCIGCKEPLRVPMLFEDCGHRCCSSCLPNVLRSTSRCPVDNTYLKQDRIVLDKDFQLKMDSLAVRCSFATGGCLWTGKFAHLGSHLTQCEHRIITCTNDCGVEFEQRYLDKHLSEDCPKRPKKCKFCDATLMAVNELKHIAVCPKFPVSCPNGCKKHEIPRSQLTDHLTTECSKQELPCPFEPHGCQFRGRKKKIEAHVTETSLEHLTMLNTSMQQITLLMQSQTKLFAELKLALAQQTKRIGALERCFGSWFIWKIDNYAEKFNLAKSGKQTTIFSPAFYTHRCGYRMALSVCLYGSGECRGKFLSVFICLCRGEHDSLLPWPFTHQLTFTLLDQHANISQRKTVEYTIKPNPTAEQGIFLGRPSSERNACFGAPRFIKLDALKSSEYIADDSMFIKVAMSMDEMPAI
ncbi:TNF receptor-associated factor 4 [Paragonimus heterotremus]|uniref:TNF receptor-associated factor 4 n=1 Tax=Paragonimus heterotremus TaxID=100268 RepID=A0A8J4TD11_9TREM|nr:TNF receptor-associated factor 4 [Paragonimus heterotremus]